MKMRVVQDVFHEVHHKRLSFDVNEKSADRNVSRIWFGRESRVSNR
jgi:hypothetical protein